MAVTDGLKGMSEALAAVFPATTNQTCIVHLRRHSLDFPNWKERQPPAKALRPIYTAPHAEAALAASDTFATSAWGVRFSPVVASWRRAWTHVIPFFALPPDVRRVIDTTMRSRACTRVFVKSSRPAAIFRPTTQRQN